MDPQTLAKLLDPAVYAQLDGLQFDRSRELAQATKLRKRGLDADVAAGLLTQAQLRGEAVGKFGEFASDMLFTRDGLAQATRLPVAAHHAGRMLASQPTVIADLGCGIGADSLAFAGLGATVLAVDSDEVTAGIAAFNLRHFSGATVEHKRAEDVDLSTVDALWLDPARRKGTTSTGAARRLNDPEAFSPSLTWVFEAATQVRSIGVKLGPALDHELIPEGWEAQWVSHEGDVVEVALYHGAALRRPGRSALVMDAAGSIEVHEDEVPSADEERIGELGDYLFEPNGALVRAGLVTALCAPLSARRISAPIAYLTGDAPATGVAARLVAQWRIAEVLPAGLKSLRKALVARGVGRLIIKKRGADIDPAQVRRTLKLPAGRPATIVFTRVGEDHVVLLLDDVKADTGDGRNHGAAQVPGALAAAGGVDAAGGAGTPESADTSPTTDSSHIAHATQTPGDPS